MKALDRDSLGRVEGGSPNLKRLARLLGDMFITAGRMALDGAAGHEIMGTK